MARDKICGIYSFVNTKNGKRYVGKSVDITERKWNHICKLRHNRHDNEYLQNSFNKYGESCFKHEILEICNKDILNDREVYWIDYFDTMNKNNGYNLQSGGLEGMELSKETKHKISLKTRGINNANGILTEDDLDYIIECVYDNYTLEEIAKSLGLSKSPIALFVQNRSHTYFKPEIRNELKNIYKTRQEDRYKKCFDLYVKYGYSQNKACKQTGVSRNTLRKMLQENGIDTQIHINQNTTKNVKYANTEVTYETKAS